MPQGGEIVQNTDTSLQTVIENPKSDIPKIDFPDGRVSPLAGDQIRTIKLGILPGGSSLLPPGYRNSTIHTLKGSIVVGEQVIYADAYSRTSQVVAIYSNPPKGQFLFLTSSGSIYAITDWIVAKDRSQIGK